MVHIVGLAFGTWKIEGESITKFRVANFFIYYLAAPLPTLGHYWGDSLLHLILITAFLVINIKPEGHLEFQDKSGSLSVAEQPVGFELGTFWFFCNVLLAYWATLP